MIEALQPSALQPKTMATANNTPVMDSRQWPNFDVVFGSVDSQTKASL